MKPADTATLNKVHARLAELYLALVAVRRVPVFDLEGQPVLDNEGNQLIREVFPTAAELAAANAFLKQNNIVAAVGNSDSLDALKERLQKKRAMSSLRPALGDPFEDLPAGFGGLQ